MVDSFKAEDVLRVNELGCLLNPKFEKLFHIDSLNKNEKIYVYRDKDNILGFIHVSINFDIVDLLNIVVDEKMRNKGIATLLMDYMIGDLPKSVKRILLEVEENNVDALRLYNRFNFEIISERANYYRNNKALIMEKEF